MMARQRERRLCCESPGSGVLEMARAFSARAWDPGSWAQFSGRRVILTYQCRTAIGMACEAWGIRPGDEVLAPAYNCGSEVDPLLHAGAKVVLYRVDRRALIDAADIRRRASARTRMLYVIHYFGWPQDLGDLPEWCRERGIPLVEDCALALFSRGTGGPIGRSGDAAVFSFPKTLPVPDGGSLAVGERGPVLPSDLARPDLRPVARKVLPLLKRQVLRTSERLGLYGAARRLTPTRSRSRDGASAAGGPPGMPPSFFFRPGTARWGISRLSRGLLAAAEPERIAERRRRNYLRMADRLRGAPGVEFLFDGLPDGVCPLGFPLRVENRRSLYRSLVARGIDAVPFWEGYHPSLSWADFPEARELKDGMLLLPIHQDLDDRHIDFIAESANDLLHGPVHDLPEVDTMRGEHTHESRSG